jgi:hypothetical protein
MNKLGENCTLSQNYGKKLCDAIEGLSNINSSIGKAALNTDVFKGVGTTSLMNSIEKSVNNCPFMQ